MIRDDVKNINDYRKRSDATDANGNAVSSKNLPARLDEKLRNAIPFELRTQMHQQVRDKYGL